MLRKTDNNKSTDAVAQYNSARLASAALLIGLTFLVLMLQKFFGSVATELLTQTLAVRQDIPVVPALLAALLIPAARGPTTLKIASRPVVLALFASIIAILLVGSLGNYLVFQNYGLSRDEQMAIFDQGIFERGRLFWPISRDWRVFADALNRRFMLPIGDREYWVSGYLPVNAAFRALVGLVASPVLASPLMTALGALCTWGIARKLWPQSNSTVLITLVLFAASSQIIITSMTAFAMSMHLALNLLWLWLFLIDRRATHSLAVVVGFLATGIHQPLFHPLFAAPFFILFVQQQRWRLLAFYLVSYMLIGLFWLEWPLWISAHGTSPATQIQCGNSVCSSGVSFIARLRTTLTGLSWLNLTLTAENLLRFICWQHPLLPPLAIVGTISFWRADLLVRALVTSFLLPIVIMAILLPWQGHGWGYRYLHPVLGNAVILAGYGYWRLQEKLSLRLPLVATSIIALIMLPVHAVMAADIATPFAKVRRAITSLPADVVIVDADNVPFGQDVVVNQFDLANKPKVLIASLIKYEDLRQLCQGRTIAFYGASAMAPISQLFGSSNPSGPSAHFIELRRMTGKIGCRTFSVSR